MEDAWVLTVRRGYRRVDGIPTIRSIISDVLVSYVLTVFLPVFSVCTILYVINNVPVFFFGCDFAV